MTILITGATGLIGAACVRYYSERADKVIAAVRNHKRAQEMFSKYANVEIITWDVTNPAPDGVVCDVIIHAACETSSKAFVEKSFETILGIVDGTRNVLLLAQKIGAKKVVYLSSMEIYGETSVTSIRECDYGWLDITNKRSSYPEAKRLAENLCVAAFHQYGVPVTIARLAQTFGEGVQRGDKRVFAQFAEAVIEGKDIILHTEGKTARCYCYLDDAVRAIETLIERGVSGEAYNVANPETYCTVREMAEMLAMLYPPTKVVVKLEDASKHGYAPDNKLNLNVEKLLALGWKPKVTLKEAFKRLVEYLRQ